MAWRPVQTRPRLTAGNRSARHLPALFLAPGTIEGRPAGLREAADRSATAAPQAAEALAVVDGKLMLEITEIAVRLSMVAQRRASGLDRFLEHGADGFGQSAGGGCRVSGRVGQDAGRPQGRKPARKSASQTYILPRPAIRFWSSRALLSGARDPGRASQGAGRRIPGPAAPRRARSAGDAFQDLRSQ